MAKNRPGRPRPKFTLHGRGCIGGDPFHDVGAYIETLRALAADPTVHAIDQAEALGRAREIEGALGKIGKKLAADAERL